MTTNGQKMAIFETFIFDFFLPNLKNKLFKYICNLYHRFWFNWDLDRFASSKWPSEPKFCERYYSVGKKTARNCCKLAKRKSCLFFCIQSLPLLTPWKSYLRLRDVKSGCLDMLVISQSFDSLSLFIFPSIDPNILRKKTITRILKLKSDVISIFLVSVMPRIKRNEIHYKH